MKRLPEDAVEEDARRSELVRNAHLAENLPLAGHERVEAGRDAEEMQRGGAIVQPVERGLDLGLERSERGDSVTLGRLRVVGRDVELGAVARREAHRLAAALREPRGERLRRLPLERDPLAQLDRRVVVRGADEDEADHPKCPAGMTTRTTMTSAKPASARYAARRPGPAREEPQPEVRAPDDPRHGRRDDHRIHPVAARDEPREADRDAEREQRHRPRDRPQRERVERRKRRNTAPEDRRRTALEPPLLPDVRAPTARPRA